MVLSWSLGHYDTLFFKNWMKNDGSFLLAVHIFALRLRGHNSVIFVRFQKQRIIMLKRPRRNHQAPTIMV